MSNCSCSGKGGNCYDFSKIKKVVFVLITFRNDKESMEQGGQMPWIDIDGFNPGEFYEQYVSYLNPNFDYLFARPQRPAKHFDIHSNSATCYFECSKVGPNPIGSTMPDLSEILKIPRIVGAQIRPTSIRKMNRAGIKDRVIMELTGHKKLENLRYYDPAPENEVKIQRSVAILGGTKKSNPSSTVTSGEAHQITEVAQVHNSASSISTVSTTYSNQK